MFRTIKFKIPYANPLEEVDERFKEVHQTVLNWCLKIKTFNKERSNHGTSREIKERTCESFSPLVQIVSREASETLKQIWLKDEVKKGSLTLGCYLKTFEFGPDLHIIFVSTSVGIERKGNGKKFSWELGSWIHRQLHQLMQYKGRDMEKALVCMDPIYSGYICSRCGYIYEGNIELPEFHRLSSGFQHHTQFKVLDRPEYSKLLLNSQSLLLVVSILTRLALAWSGLQQDNWR